MEEVKRDVVEHHAEMISFPVLQLPSAEMGTHTDRHITIQNFSDTYVC